MLINEMLRTHRKLALIEKSYSCTDKQLRFLQQYAFVHHISIAGVVRIAIDHLMDEERLKEIKRIKGTF